MFRKPAQLELSHRTLPTGEEAAHLEGELDIVTADAALAYVQELLDSHGGPVVANLAGIRFCDARGLRALLRMAAYAEEAGCPFRVVSPSPFMARLMRLTGVDLARHAENSRTQSPAAGSTRVTGAIPGYQVRSHSRDTQPS